MHIKKQITLALAITVLISGATISAAARTSLEACLDDSCSIELPVLPVKNIFSGKTRKMLSRTLSNSSFFSEGSAFAESDLSSCTLSLSGEIETKDKGESLVNAARVGDFHEVLRLLVQLEGKMCDNCAECSSIHESKCSALMMAASNGNIALVQLFLAHKADVNWQNNGDKTVLIAAAERFVILPGWDCWVESLERSRLEHSLVSELSEKSIFNWRNKEVGASEKDAGLAKITEDVRCYSQAALIKAVGAVVLSGTHSDYVAPELKKLFEHAYLMHILLEAKADIDIESDDGSSAISCAAKQGHDFIVHMLLEQAPQGQREELKIVATKSAEQNGFTRAAAAIRDSKI